ncbi:hypothetical protein C2S51_001851 [Perilla frutescens var. frutescens]|nr:hypothetical protein C2S51_001851 [Perilla frutescens var. frutescens]
MRWTDAIWSGCTMANQQRVIRVRFGYGDDKEWLSSFTRESYLYTAASAATAAAASASATAATAFATDATGEPSTSSLSPAGDCAGIPTSTRMSSAPPHRKSS